MALSLLLEFFRQGIGFRYGEGGRMECFSQEELSQNTLEVIRKRKKEVFETLELLRYFGNHLGEAVSTPQGVGILWGVSPYGVSVLFPGKAVFLFDPVEVKLS